jgi:fatty-acyl-CoA synthase
VPLIKPGLAYWVPEPTVVNLCRDTVGNYFDQKAVQYRDYDAVTFSSYEKLNIPQTTWSYKEYKTKVDELAKALIAAGYQRGDHIAVWSINVPEWLILEMACAQLGIVLVTMNPALRMNEAQYILEKSDAAAIFLLSHFANRSYVQEVQEMKKELPQLEHIYTFNDCRVADVTSYQSLLSKSVSDSVLQDRKRQVNPEDIFQIQFTSGTTGFPKGAMLTHRNALNNAILTFQRWEISEGDKVFSPLPLFHTAGSILVAIGCISVGAAYFPQPYFIPDDAVNVLKREKITHYAGVPTMHQGILNVLENNPSELSLKLLMSGGAPVPKVLIEKLEKRTDAKFVVLMGMTETSPVFSATGPKDSVEKRHITSGTPLEQTELRIVDPETREVLDCNETGEIEVRGFMVMRGYYKMEDKTNEVLDSQGWLKTGDLGILDDDGYLNVIGRLKDMIIRGGENIYPREVEDFLLTHPNISEAQVVGIPDEYYGEIPVAFIKPRPGETLVEEEVLAYCKGKISHQKIPKYIQVVEVFPLTASGKIQKNILREQFIGQSQKS